MRYVWTNTTSAIEIFTKTLKILILYYFIYNNKYNNIKYITKSLKIRMAK